MHQIRHYFVFFCWLCYHTLPAQNSIHLSGAGLQKPLFEQMEFAREEGYSSFDIDRLACLDFRSFNPDGYYASIKNQSLWFRFSLNNTTTQTLSYVLSIQNSYLRQGDVYLLSSGNSTSLAPNADENSNHYLIQSEWSWVGLYDVDGERSSNTAHENLCNLLEDRFDNRCRNASGEIIENCPQVGSVTLRYSGFGTVMVSYFDPQGVLLVARQDYWRCNKILL